MGIATLGKSLLSSAKKKSKRGQQLGLFAGAAIGVAGVVNRSIRKKAIERADKLENNLMFMKQQQLGELKKRDKFVTELNDRSDTSKFVNIDESFIKPLQDFYTDRAKQAPDGETNLEAIRAEAVADAQDDILRFKETHELYKPYLDVDSTQLTTQYTKLQKLSRKEIESDNLWNRIGNKFRGTPEGEKAKTSILLDQINKLGIDIPTETLNKVDISFLTALGDFNTRNKEINSLADSVVNDFETLDDEDGVQLQAFYKRVTKPKAGKEFEIDKRVDDALDLILAPTWDDPATAKDKNVANPYFIGETMFTNSKDKKKVSLSVGKIITQLQKTKDGKVITNPALTQQSDWDIMRNDIREHVQLKIAAHIKTPNSGAINDALVRQWSTEAWKEVSSQLELTGSEGAFGFGDTRTARYKPTEIKIDPKIQTQLDNFKAYLNSPVFLVGTKQQQQGIINTFKRKYPTVADQIFYNPGVAEGEEESTLADSMQKSLIDPVTLIPTPELTDINISDRPIINKIIEVESSGNPNAVSDHGAKGLMQLKDSTADNPGLGVTPAVRNADGSISPEENVRVGTDYFDALTTKYNGDLITAAMAYNAGMGTIDKWIEDGRDFSKLRTETQNYVKKIFGEEAYNELKNSTTTTNFTPAPSLLEPTAELTDSEIIAGALKGTGRNPLEVLRDSKIKNLEKAVTRMKAGKPNIGTSSSAVVRWLKNTKDTDYYKLSTEERIASTEEYIKTLKS
jgi:soluble lytic murein transglycosylase